LAALALSGSTPERSARESLMDEGRHWCQEALVPGTEEVSYVPGTGNTRHR